MIWLAQLLLVVVEEILIWFVTSRSFSFLTFVPPFGLLAELHP